MNSPESFDAFQPLQHDPALQSPAEIFHTELMQGPNRFQSWQRAHAIAAERRAAGPDAFERAVDEYDMVALRGLVSGVMREVGDRIGDDALITEADAYDEATLQNQAIWEERRRLMLELLDQEDKEEEGDEHRSVALVTPITAARSARTSRRSATTGRPATKAADELVNDIREAFGVPAIRHRHNSGRDRRAA